MPRLSSRNKRKAIYAKRNGSRDKNKGKRPRIVKKKKHSRLECKPSRAYPGACSGKSKGFILWRYAGKLLDNVIVSDIGYKDNPDEVINFFISLMNKPETGFRRNYTRHVARKWRKGKGAKDVKYSSKGTGKFYRPEYDLAQIGIKYTAVMPDGTQEEDKFSFGRVGLPDGDFNLFIERQFDYILWWIFKNPSWHPAFIQDLTIDWHWYRPTKIPIKLSLSSEWDLTPEQIDKYKKQHSHE